MSPADALAHADALQALTQEALTALRSFLATFLGAEPALTATAPEEVDAPPAAAEPGAVVAVYAEASQTPFAVVMEPGGAALLAEAMLGAPVPDEEAPDLVAEALSQAYGTVRTHLGQEGPALPDLRFAVHAAEDAPALPEAAWNVTVTLEHGGAPLRASLYLPRREPAAARQE
ncbi:MAG: hypothetical protein R3362_11300, partial [Rhodothermales bacterium]|nr:hypothetical protein [Rhodothermales bacterium]